jgi:hypothetical protein
MSVKSKAMKALVVVAAAGALTMGGATAAIAADGSGSGSGTATAAPRLRNYPGVRHALRTAFGAAADTLGTTAEELRAQMVQGHQSLADVAGDQSDEVASAIVASLSASIDQAVTNGNLPVERAEQLKARLPQIVERLMHRVPGQNAQQ